MIIYFISSNTIEIKWIIILKLDILYSNITTLLLNNI